VSLELNTQDTHLSGYLGGQPGIVEGVGPKCTPDLLGGVDLVTTDDHAGLSKAIAEVFTEAVWQHCYFQFLRNALDYLPGKPTTIA
jgi:hypothetical protein